MVKGIFGGTFDPIHLGHLRAAEEAREAFGLDQVDFVPCAWPPHKSGGPAASAFHRLEMVRRAVEGVPCFGCNPMEVEAGGASYTVHTLEAMQSPGDRLFFMVGMDAFLEIHTWKEYARLFCLADMIVMSRPWEDQVLDLGRAREYVLGRLKGLCRMHGSAACLAPGSGPGRVFFASVSRLDISATDIRQRLALGKSVRFLVPRAVQEYIEETGIYI